MRGQEAAEDEEEDEEYSQQMEDVEEGTGGEENPLLAAASRSREGTPRSFKNSQAFNPFKRNTPTSASEGKKGMSAMDQFRKSQKKNESPSILRPVVKKPGAKQATLKPKESKEPKEDSGKENLSENLPSPAPAAASPAASPNPFKKQSTAADSPAAAPRASALALWLADNEELVKERFPEA